MKHTFKKLAVTQADRVAELMALDLDRDQIGARLGITGKAVSARMAEIRKGLGWQAC